MEEELKRLRAENRNIKEHGSIHLHGHTHKPDNRPNINRYNIGCTLYDYKPVTLDYLLKGGN